MHLCHNLNESLQGDSKKYRQNGHDFSSSSSYDVCNSLLVSSCSHDAVCFDIYFRLPIAKTPKVIILFFLNCINWQVPTIAEKDTGANFSFLLDPKNNLLFNKFLAKNLWIIVLQLKIEKGSLRYVVGVLQCLLNQNGEKQYFTYNIPTLSM